MDIYSHLKSDSGDKKHTSDHTNFYLLACVMISRILSVFMLLFCCLLLIAIAIECKEAQIYTLPFLNL